ncbi:hypothetical protein FCR2A7T_29360 [Flavobacterium cauense R2A-7]|uniref:hypothetical protein n=1 Tax=Flavobacterium cauense TaxID=510946 RepID=UPI0003C5D5DA|nr:hypothetical protein [Flavobacterium cauense]ESU18454.1 hypothetical protein FCR2A7T_29360 [Flavobacterium cauense R2A-7]KGO78768.1 hypothetical protein Q762_14945 [Flavobacterium cauense R2A-7]
MDRNLSYFVYQPPKSNSHGHGVRDKNILRGLKKVIDVFTENFGEMQSDKLELDLYYDKANEEEFILAKNTISKLEEFLGLSIRQWENTGYEHLKDSMSWENDKKNIFDLLTYLNTYEDEALLPLNQFSISQFYNYGDNKTANGYIMCSIESGKLFIRLHLILPYPIEDERAYELIGKLNKELPFKLSNKNFKRLGPNKNRYGQWKLDDEIQKRLDSYLK